MKARQAVVCGKCGALNRPTWEFCARCNESLESALPVEEGSASPQPAAEPQGGASTASGNGIAVVAALALVGLGVAGWRYASNAPPLPRPDPSLFTAPTRPPQPPTVAKPAVQPGAADFQEGRRLLSAGDAQGAAVRLAAAVAADPDNAEYHNVYGHALWRTGDREAAIAEHSEAARLDPRLQMQYARTLDVAGHTAEAARQYEEILEKSPGALTVQEDLGRMLFRSGDYAKAASHLQQAFQARPDDPVLAQELAYSLDQAGDHARAADMYRQVLDQAPQAAVARGLLAETLAEQGKRAEALSLLDQGLKDTPASPLLHREKGSVLERSGRPADAAASYRTYARLAPNANDAKELVARAARLEAAGSRR
jgi:Flp pilus assembly protein TadD